MCAITGLVRFDNQKISEGTLIRMRDSMRHRGPDDAGLYINKEKSLALGHRRLSVLDLSSRAGQPMCSEDENTWLVHNGEIYNFPEIKKELIYSGHFFNSGSDTEVILKAYQEWGEESFEKLNGMYAFSIYDRRKGLLYLVRDHAGIKPLYYSISDRRLIFSSEVRAFKAFDGDWQENGDWKILFLIFGHIPAPFSTLKDVYMLPKGSFLKLDLNTKAHSVHEYAGFAYTGEISDPGEAVRGTREMFTKAVERHLVSDAPIGVFLSGGMDSSLITLLAGKFQGNNLKTLSVVFNEKGYSEKYYQDLILDRVKSEHHSCPVTEEDFMGSLDDIFRSMDQPTIDGVNTYFISKFAADAGLKAVLSGLGGDELFGGYPSFDRISTFWPIRDSAFAGLLRVFKYSGRDKLKKLSFLSLKSPLGFYLLFRGLYTPESVARLLGVSEKEVEGALGKVYVGMQEGIGKKNFVSCLETGLYMRNQLLKDSDFMSMRHSVEIRLPYLDRDLMRFVFSVKDTVKFDSGTPKHLLVKAFEDILPQEIMTRKKQGFTFPFDSWMRNMGKDIFREAISGGAVSKKYAERLWNKFERGDLHWSRIWSLAVMGKRSSSFIPKDVYIFRIGQLGDTLVAVPAISKIKKKHNNDNLILITNKPDKDFFVTAWDVLKYAHYFKNVIFYDAKDVRSLIKTIQKIRANSGDKILYYLAPSRSKRQISRDRFFFKALCGIEKTIGIKESFYKNIIRDKDGRLERLEKESERLLKTVYKMLKLEYRKEDLSKPPLLFPPTEVREKVNNLLAGLPSNNRLIGIGHGSKYPATRWELNRFKKLCDLLINLDEEISLVIFGGGNDFTKGDYLRKGFEKRSANLCGQTDVIESAEAVSRCCLFIGNDSGPIHLAGSMGVSCIGIYSARNNPGKWEPYGENHVILRKDVECAGCFLEECNKNKMRCLNMISINEVFEAAVKLLC